MAYVDGFLLPLSQDKVEAYRKHAESAGKIWMEHGALAFKECIGDDLASEELVQFPQVIDTKDNETVIFSYIVFKDREHRDAVNAKVMADSRLKDFSCEDIFDFKRMAYGGFKMLVDL